MEKNMNNDELIEMVKVKIETNDGLFYTLKTITKGPIRKFKEIIDERDNCSYTYESVINILVKSEIERLVCEGGIHSPATGFSVDGNLVYLKEENKIINKNQIKQSLIQILEPITSL